MGHLFSGHESSVAHEQIPHKNAELAPCYEPSFEKGPTQEVELANNPPRVVICRFYAKQVQTYDYP